MDGIQFRAVRRGLVVVACIAALTAAGSVAGASAGVLGGGLAPSCSEATSTPFAQWGDYARYVSVQDGGFEGGGAGWKLSGGATVVVGNEPFHVAGAGDARSLALAPGAAATSKPLCFGTGYPNFRFFAAAATGVPVVHVKIIYNGLLGVVGVFDGGSVAVGDAWAPTASQSLLLGNVVAVAPLGTTSVSLQFTVTGGTARIDDVFVDPIKEV